MLNAPRVPSITQITTHKSEKSLIDPDQLSMDSLRAYGSLKKHWNKSGSKCKRKFLCENLRAMLEFPATILQPLKNCRINRFLVLERFLLCTLLFSLAKWFYWSRNLFSRRSRHNKNRQSEAKLLKRLEIYWHSERKKYLFFIFQLEW